VADLQSNLQRNGKGLLPGLEPGIAAGCNELQQDFPLQSGLLQR
jgi:hypothetical protein